MKRKRQPILLKQVSVAVTLNRDKLQKPYRYSLFQPRKVIYDLTLIADSTLKQLTDLGKKIKTQNEKNGKKRQTTRALCSCNDFVF